MMLFINNSAKNAPNAPQTCTSVRLSLQLEATAANVGRPINQSSHSLTVSHNKRGDLEEEEEDSTPTQLQTHFQ